MGELISALIEGFGLSGVVIAALMLTVVTLAGAVVVLFNRYDQFRTAVIVEQKLDIKDGVEADRALALSLSMLTQATDGLSDLVKTITIPRRRPN